MSLGMCLLLCVLSYQLALYNERHPGRLWEFSRQGLARLKDWSGTESR
jgi:hypothetical protein